MNTQKNYHKMPLSQTPKPILKQSVPLFLGMFICIVYFIYDIVSGLIYEGGFGTAQFTFELFTYTGLSIAVIAGVRYVLIIRARLYWEEQKNYVYSKNLVQILNQQMAEWKMTPTEQEIAWLIIKGHRFSEIAKLRGVKESTTRLQATSIYSKAGVNSRSEFVAEFFNTVLMLTDAGTMNLNQP